MFDSHCHLTAPQLAPQFESALERALAAGVTGFLNIGDNLVSSRLACFQAKNTPEHSAVMCSSAGIHPQNALEFSFDTSITELRDLAREPEVVAIGEIGLDYLYDDAHPEYPGASRNIQERVFRAQLELALELDLPIVIHNRHADDDLLRIVADYAPGLRGVFHCFGSAPEVAQRVLNLGFHLGFTGLLTFKNAEQVRTVARLCPTDRLLIETDSPYLAPVPYRGKTNEPSYLPRVAETLASLHQTTVLAIDDLTTRNTERLFRIRTR